VTGNKTAQEKPDKTSQEQEHIAADLARLVDQYALALKAAGAIRSAAVEAAFRRVPRHQLIERFYQGRVEDIVEIDPSDPAHLALIYSNKAFTTRWWPAPSSSTLPTLMALMLELLKLRPGMRVLEIGAGTGYNAALLAELVGDQRLVTTLDLQEDVVTQTRRNLAAAGYGQIHVLARDGFAGYSDFAPYDRIVATVGCSDLSPHWLDQLAPDGFLLIPLAHGDVFSCPLTRVWQQKGRIYGRVVGYASFMAVRGELRRDAWLSEDDNLMLSQLVNTSDPDTTYPLFEGLTDYPEPRPGLPSGQAAHLEFFYFLALHTSRTFWTWRGPGLGGTQGCVLLADDSIQLYGNQARACYRELDQIYHLWEQKGKPGMREYQLEFSPLPVSSEHKSVSGANSWTINRKFFQQIVRL
jgi:protein-L-isoaspartate(D-aspartate) O-methyltransferase